MSVYPASGTSLNNLMVTQASVKKDATAIPPATSLPQKYTSYNMTSSSGQRDSLSNDRPQGDLKVEDEIQFGKLSKNDGFDCLESIVRIKEAEARMFHNKADEALREGEDFKRMIRSRTEKLEEEYAHSPQAVQAVFARDGRKAEEET